MKSLSPLIFILFFSTFSFAQADIPELKPPAQTTLFVEFYKPVFTNSVKYYDNNSIVFQNNESYSRDYNVFAIGVGVETVLKNNIVLRPRVGLTVIDLINGTESRIENEVQDFTSTFESALVYEQNYINLFFGLSKRMQLSNSFNIDFGMDLAFISYLKGTSELYSISTFRDPFFNSRSQQWDINNYGGAMSFGIGPIIKPEYKFNKISVSFEIQYYFMNTISNNQINQIYMLKTVYSQNGFETTDESTETSEISIDFTEWSWSEFSPLIRIGYSF